MRVRISHLIRVTAAALIALTMIGIAPAQATTTTVVAKATVVRASTGQMTCREACFDPTPGNDAVVRANVGTKFTAIATVSFTMTFSGDLVDPGESVSLMSGNGFINFGTTPISVRTVSLTSDSPSQISDVNTFLDGHQTFDIWMDPGSAQLTRVDVTIVGQAQP